jgi:hypothetical protein
MRYTASIVERGSLFLWMSSTTIYTHKKKYFVIEDFRLSQQFSANVDPVFG